ncbi:hypothetical protein [Lutibacter sp.]|uniref:hypothetical protein n=1 Tax=Lutibacter sp. TaxID=1925666 RepID=UPI0034A05526
MKAIISLRRPIIITFVLDKFGDWKLDFVIYTRLSLISILWLSVAPIYERIKSEIPAAIKSLMQIK